MLRYKTETEAGLVALYDIRGGNRAGQFLQPVGRTGPVGIITLTTIVKYTNLED